MKEDAPARARKRDQLPPRTRGAWVSEREARGGGAFVTDIGGCIFRSSNW